MAIMEPYATNMCCKYATGTCDKSGKMDMTKHGNRDHIFGTTRNKRCRIESSLTTVSTLSPLGDNLVWVEVGVQPISSANR
jgi:hypothetical protein